MIETHTTTTQITNKERKSNLFTKKMKNSISNTVYKDF